MPERPAPTISISKCSLALWSSIHPPVAAFMAPAGRLGKRGGFSCARKGDNLLKRGDSTMTRAITIFAVAAAALIAAPTSLSAQAPSVPAGMPGANPYVSGDGVDSRAGRTMPSEADRLAIDAK